MRYLQLTAKSDYELRVGMIHTLCVMTYPNDMERGGLMLKELVKSGTDTLSEADAGTLDALRLDKYLLNGLAEIGRPTLRGEAARQFAKGNLAGRVLLYALACGVYRPEHRSVSKAVYLVAENANAGGGKSELAMSESRILNYWKEFQSVAHLHAAQMVVESRGANWLNDLGIIEQASRFACFLAVAGRISRAAHDQTPPIGRMSQSAAHDGRRLIDFDRTIQIQIDDISFDLDDRKEISSLFSDWNCCITNAIRLLFCPLTSFSPLIDAASVHLNERCAIWRVGRRQKKLRSLSRYDRSLRSILSYSALFLNRPSQRRVYSLHRAP